MKNPLCVCARSYFVCLSFLAKEGEVDEFFQDKIAEIPSLDRMTEEYLKDLFGEEMYMGEIDWLVTRFQLRGITERKGKKIV